jgi:uncharacterized membrane protein
MSAPFAELTLDPAWPWSLPGMGVPALLMAGVVLAALTAWTYLGVRGASWRRVLAVLALRLLALVVACLVVLRPSFADREQAVIPSKLIILLDASGSMNISDEFNGQSRWDAARRILKAPGVERLLRRLQNEQKVEIVFYQGAEDIARFDPGGKATGKRTDVGQWLSALLKIHGGEQNLRGLVLLTDGADNGTRFPAVQEAARWRGIPCPIYAFALGSPTTSPKQRDIAVTAIHTDPPLVPVKTKLTVKATINAPGLEDQVVRVHLLIDGKTVASTTAQLRKTQGNEVLVGEYRPEKVGEIKVTVKVDRVEDEITEANNEMSTYVTVTNEGVRVLWVEGKKRAYEPVLAIREALARDKRFEVSYTERHGDEREAANKDWFNFQKEHYDVIVIGDISAKQFSGGRPEIFTQIQSMVKDRGTGLLMLGGYDTFANRDWPQRDAQPLTNMLPVELNDPGQIDRRVLMVPRPVGLEYVLRISEGDPMQVWRGDDPRMGFRPLDGMTKIGKVRPGSAIFADAVDTNGQKWPIMAARTFGAGRTLVFGGDTTWKAWRRNEVAIKAYERFWKQVVLWLAKREDASGNTYVMIDSNTRRVAAGGNKAVGFTLGVRGKGGLPVPGARFLVKVKGPKEETVVQTVQEDKQERGYFYRTNEPGEYTVWAKASGKDLDGSPLDDRPATAKFLVYAEDLESLRPAADHEFLKNLAAAGGGTAYVGGEDRMSDFLERLLAEPLLPSRARAELWPDWRRTPVGDSAGEQLAALWTSGLLLAFFLFVMLLSLEWFLRRRWGMV